MSGIIKIIIIIKKKTKRNEMKKIKNEKCNGAA